MGHPLLGADGGSEEATVERPRRIRHHQELRAILAQQLSSFYDADPFTDKGHQMVEELTEWLNKDRKENDSDA